MSVRGCGRLVFAGFAFEFTQSVLQQSPLFLPGLPPNGAKICQCHQHRQHSEDQAKHPVSGEGQSSQASFQYRQSTNQQDGGASQERRPQPSSACFSLAAFIQLIRGCSGSRFVISRFAEENRTFGPRIIFPRSVPIPSGALPVVPASASPSAYPTTPLCAAAPRCRPTNSSATPVAGC